MKKLFALLLALALLLAGCGNGTEGTAPEGETEGDNSANEALPRLEIEFDYVKQDGYSTNQFAVWVTDTSYNYITTLYVTDFTASGGYEKRPNALKKWVSSANPAAMDESALDAVASATPDSGKIVVTWDLKDANGNQVPDGEYYVFLEATLRDENSVSYGALIEVGGPPKTIEPIADYTGEGEDERGMISNVEVRYFSNVVAEPEPEIPPSTGGDETEGDNGGEGSESTDEPGGEEE